MPDVGDLVTASLTVTPFDGTTSASLLVTRPDGTTVSPVVTGSGGGQAWTAPVTYTVAGIWRLSWTVTGTGASVEHELVSVAPTPGVAGTGRVYATTTQLANYLHAAPPLDSARLLDRASKLLDDQVLRACWYEVDDDGMPTDAVVADAFAAAVCAQVEWWEETGDELGAAEKWETVELGSATMTAAKSSSGDSGSGGGRTVAATAMEKLRSPDLTRDRFVLGLVFS